MQRSRIRLLVVSIAVAALLGVAPRGADAAAPDSSARADSVALRARRGESRFYFGGSLGITLSGRLTILTAQPLVGYKLTPKTSVGTRLTYEYARDGRYQPARTWTNVGLGAFGRYRFIAQGYAHAEFEMAHVDAPGGENWVPFLWLGGGYARPLAPRTWLLAEVLIDILRSDRAPSYRNNDPRVSVGVVTGF